MEPFAQLSIAATDANLIARVQAGDRQAFGTLVQRYERAVLAAAWPVLRDRHAAQDVVQDVFVHCFNRLGTLRDASRFGPWLLRTAGREAVHAAKRRRRMRLVSDINVSTLPQTKADESPMLDDERQRLLNCVRSLPTHERLVISLRYFEGHDVRAIATFTGRPVGTVTKQLSRAIDRLREQLNKDSPSWKRQTMKTA